MKKTVYLSLVSIFLIMTVGCKLIQTDLNAKWEDNNFEKTRVEHPANAVRLFSDADYKGNKALFTVGQYNQAALAAAGMKNNDAHSIIITPGYKAIVFTGGNFDDLSKVFTTDAGRLGGKFSNQVSSLIVEFIGSDDDDDDDNNDNDDNNNNDNDNDNSHPHNAVRLWSDPDWKGTMASFSVGDYNQAAMAAAGIKNNDAHSIRILPGYEATLYTGGNFDESSKVFTADAGRLGGKFSNQVSSLRVRYIGDDDDDDNDDNTPDYKNKLTIVLGDVKQALIHNKISNTQQADKLLAGFSKLQVTGIRFPIFATNNINPNKPMYDYLFKKAKEKKFKIFANPALHAGGQRIANGLLFEIGPSVLGNMNKKDKLVKRIKEYAREYKCAWISPFNEDGRVGNIWNKQQINQIYIELKGKLNNAKLIGPCTWGLTAGIEVMNNTRVKEFVSIATTHNLGFEHSKWPQFLSAAGNLDVWDSETNNNKKFADRDTRIIAAIKAGVNGLVLYNSWNTIDLSNGSLKNSGNELKAIYLK